MKYAASKFIINIIFWKRFWNELTCGGYAPIFVYDNVQKTLIIWSFAIFSRALYCVKIDSISHFDMKFNSIIKRQKLDAFVCTSVMNIKSSHSVKRNDRNSRRKKNVVKNEFLFFDCERDEMILNDHYELLYFSLRKCYYILIKCLNKNWCEKELLSIGRELEKW